MTQKADKQAEQAGWEFVAATVNEKRQNDKTAAGNKKKLHDLQQQG